MYHAMNGMEAKQTNRLRRNLVFILRLQWRHWVIFLTCVQRDVHDIPNRRPTSESVFGAGITFSSFALVRGFFLWWLGISV
jgi:hypothetical protein